MSQEPAAQTPGRRLVDIIPVHAYPAPVRRTDTKAFLHRLLSEETAERAAQVIAERSAELRDVVLGYIARLVNALDDAEMAGIHDEAHEIRGMAEMIGLASTGRIANGLCKYLDALERGNVAPDLTVVGLHVEAIARAARADGEASQLGGRVAEELTALVARKLSDTEREGG